MYNPLLPDHVHKQANKEEQLTLIILMISLGPILFGSNSTCALPVAKATEADLMPLLLTRVRSIRLTHEEQDMPVTCIMDVDLYSDKPCAVCNN